MPISQRPAPLSLLSPGVLVPVLLCCAVELVLLAADHGVMGNSHWRSLSYQYAGFWVGLLYDWQPNYALQPITMFFSYSFLHAGIGHLMGNMVTLLVLGSALRPAMSDRMIFLLLFVSSLGGALAFGLLSRSPAPMVGASGAIFGLVGAWMTIRTPVQPRHGTLVRNLAIVAGLIGMNALLWWWNGGWLAWEAHLGGFLAGLGLGFYRRPILEKTRS